MDLAAGMLFNRMPQTRDFGAMLFVSVQRLEVRDETTRMLTSICDGIRTIGYSYQKRILAGAIQKQRKRHAGHTQRRIRGVKARSESSPETEV